VKPGGKGNSGKPTPIVRKKERKMPAAKGIEGDRKKRNRANDLKTHQEKEGFWKGLLRGGKRHGGGGVDVRQKRRKQENVGGGDDLKAVPLKFFHRKNIRNPGKKRVKKKREKKKKKTPNLEIKRKGSSRFPTSPHGGGVASSSLGPSFRGWSIQKKEKKIPP